MSRLKYALIGYGRRGIGHLATVAEMKDSFEVVAVCDAHPQSAEETESKILKRIWVELPESLGGMIEWINPYQPKTYLLQKPIITPHPVRQQEKRAILFTSAIAS